MNYIFYLTASVRGAQLAFTSGLFNKALFYFTLLFNFTIKQFECCNFIISETYIIYLLIPLHNKEIIQTYLSWRQKKELTIFIENTYNSDAPE